ncbi:hypothetical protein PLICRDRAFT_33872 [Plicaturopsis crispa FD-325 SS-3]|nr:hypothetical protein PLICRDRAFT_33872 [Plicaturopsis crispa FD-325 SS-3]
MKYVWLDADPGHDDATAILLAIHCPNIQLLGVSTVHGNADAQCTAKNAARCLFAFAASKDVRVYPGASKPLLRPAKHDPEIHGEDGLGGVEGLPNADHPEVNSYFADPSIGAVEAMANSIRSTWNSGNGSQVTVVSCGPMTNVALFVSVHPELLPAVEEFVFMGGGVGLGNRSAVAEYNILCDPEAAQIVLDSPVRTVMIPINVTHTAIVTKRIHSKLLTGGEDATDTDDTPKASSPLRHTLSTLIAFFAESYKSTFGFNLGPPLHDPLTIAYVSRPDLFTCERHRVDVELHGTHTSGETVVDVYKYRQCDDSWGSTGRNCLVAVTLDVERFFNDIFLDCVARCDKVSPLNK